MRTNKLLGVLGGPKYLITYGKGDVVSYYTITVFDAEIVAGAVHPDGEEAAALGFVSQAEAADLPMAEWTKELVSLAFDRRDEPYFAPATWRPSVLTP